MKQNTTQYNTKWNFEKDQATLPHDYSKIGPIPPFLMFLTSPLYVLSKLTNDGFLIPEVKLL